MNAVLSILIVASALALLPGTIVIALSRHRKAAIREVKLIGAVGFVDSRLDPEGTVIVEGELWRARSKQKAVVKTGTKVRITGLQTHLLIVEPKSGELELGV
jgi:membrane-bound serine protease (ClpP class)